MRKLALGAAFALALSAFPLASAVTSTSAGAVDTSVATLHVVNALGTTDPDNQEPQADVTADTDLDCDSTSGHADIPVIDPNGTADDGSHTFTVDPGTQFCRLHVDATSEVDLIAGGTRDIDFDCDTPPTQSNGKNKLDLLAGHVYKAVIEPVYTTSDPDTTAAAFPLALTDCEIKVWEDDVSILPNNQARVIFRQAACNTGENFHILSVEANGSEILGEIDPCGQGTALLDQGVYDFTLHVMLDYNGDGDFDDQFTVFDPNTCTSGGGLNLFGPSGNFYSLTGCPTLDESEEIEIPIDGISLAHGEIFAFNFVDDGTGHFIPFLAGGANADDPLNSDFAGGFLGLFDCNEFNSNIPAPIPNAGGVTVLAGLNAPGCAGGGVGVIAGPATVQVEFDGNEFVNDANLTTFCNDVITKFQSTVKAETDYIATLTVVDETDTTLEGLVDATDALIAELKLTAPPEILDAVLTLTDGLNQLNQGLRAAGFNTATLGADNLALIQDGLANPPDNPDVTAATAELTTFVTTQCFGSNATPAEPVAAGPRFTG